jgi:glycosyltransferase involved in cell wall biosynthesis
MSQLYPDEPNSPFVTVIVATYNYSNVLRYALESVRWQTFTDFEVWVVGDHCTDDTEQVVAEFTAVDARFKWHNLPENFGNQAGPNQKGLELARGQYIAYNNHDDLWHPSHLETLVGAIRQATQPPLFLRSWIVCVGPKGSGQYAISGPEGYRPDAGTMAATVMHHIEARQKGVSWRDFRHMTLQPTNDFAARVVALDPTRVLDVHELTAYKFPSVWFKNSYVEKPVERQAEYFQRIRTEPEMRYRELANVMRAMALGKDQLRVWPKRPANAPPGYDVIEIHRLRGLPPIPGARTHASWLTTMRRRIAGRGLWLVQRTRRLSNRIFDFMIRGLKWANQ